MIEVKNNIISFKKYGKLYEQNIPSLNLEYARLDMRNNYKIVSGKKITLTPSEELMLRNIVANSFTKEEILNEAKNKKIAQLPSSLLPVTVNTVTYNGGASSASAISGAVILAQALGETDVKLWDINNSIATYTFEEAQSIAAQIAQAYRDTKIANYEKTAQIKACTTQEELDAIVI